MKYFKYVGLLLICIAGFNGADLLNGVLIITGMAIWCKI